MQKYRLSFEDALQFVQSRRYCMHINQGFLHQIKVSLSLSAFSSRASLLDSKLTPRCGWRAGVRGTRARLLHAGSAAGRLHGAEEQEGGIG